MTVWLRVVAVLALTLLLAWFAQRHVPDLRAAVNLLSHARPLPLLFALLFQFLYYVFAALLVAQCLRLVGHHAPFGWLLRATFLLIFVSRIVPGPAAAGPAAMYYLLERRGVPKGRSALIGPIFYAVDYAMYFALLAVGLLMVAARGGGIDAGAVAGATITLVTAAVVFAFVLRRPARLHAVLAGVVSAVNRVARAARIRRRVPTGAPTAITQAVEEAREQLRRVPGIGWALAGSGLAMLLCDVASMACAFLAFGVWVGVPVAFLGFCLATAGALVSVLPGGLGTFDAAMVLGFTSLGVPRAPTLAATLSYRVLATWLPALLGFFAARILLDAPARGRGTV